MFICIETVECFSLYPLRAYEKALIESVVNCWGSSIHVKKMSSTCCHGASWIIFCSRISSSRHFVTNYFKAAVSFHTAAGQHHPAAAASWHTNDVISQPPRPAYGVITSPGLVGPTRLRSGPFHCDEKCGRSDKRVRTPRRPQSATLVPAPSSLSCGTAGRR